jgi:hypothetical protein
MVRSATQAIVYRLTDPLVRQLLRYNQIESRMIKFAQISKQVRGGLA